MEELETQFNKFFYRIQYKRMLGLGYMFFTKIGFWYTIIVIFLAQYFMSLVFLFAAAIGYGYIYLKEYNLKLEDRETVWFFDLWRKWLGREEIGKK